MASDFGLASRYLEPLLAVGSYGLPDSTRMLPVRPLADEMWRSALDSARYHRLTGLLCSAIGAGAFPATAEQAQQARQYQLAAVTWVMRLELELVGLAELLSASAIDFRVLKGPGVAYLDYPNPSLRSFADLDILIRSEQVDFAIATLIAHGFRRCDAQPRPGFDRRFSKGTAFLSPTGYELDLHRTFVKGAWGMLVDLDDLWDDGQEFMVADRTFRALSRLPRLMHACYNAALGNWPPRLASLRDVAQTLLTTEVDEQAFRKLSERWRSDAVVTTAIADAWNLFGISRDTAVSAWAQGVVPSTRDAVRLSLHRSESRNSSTLAFSALSSISGLGDKMAFLRAMVLPEAQYMGGRHYSAAARLRYGIREVRRGYGSR